jgi:competence protein ComEC
VLGDGVYLDILGPALGEFSNPTAKANDVMVVGRLVYGADSVFLAGDIEREDEIRLARSGVDMKSDILKVAHHGSKTSSLKVLLDRIRPQLAVISVGESNRYGHPHREVFDRLAAIGARVLRTDIDGRVEMILDGMAGGLDGF